MLKKKLLSLILATTLIISLVPTASASSNQTTDEQNYVTFYDDLLLEWNSNEGRKTLTSAATLTGIAEYTYNSNNHRITKSLGDDIASFEYDEEGKLIREQRGDHLFTYSYETVTPMLKVVSSFTIDGTQYSYEKDENQTVMAIIDETGHTVAKYEYDDGLVTNVLGLDENDNWVSNNNDDFIGNLNLIRLYSYYFDSETGWYYCHRYYDPLNKGFVTDGNGGITIYSSTYAQNSLLDYVNYEVDRVMNSSYYGRPIEYSENWHSGLTTYELFARLIYGENTSYEEDQNAIGYCMLNRYHGNDGHSYPDNMPGVARSGFAAITGNANDTYWARQPDTSSAGWRHATFVGMAISLSDYDISACEEVFPRPSYMTYQTQFTSYSYFINHTRNGNGCIQYYLGEKWNDLRDVIIPGVGTYSNLSDLMYDYRYGFTGESNIHFGYAE